MPKLPVAESAVKGRAIAVAAFTLVATTGAAPGPDASQAELMAYSFGSAATVIAFVWIAVKLWRQIVQTTVLLAILLMFYLLAKLVVDAVLGA
jgi:hypothetical protein